MPQTLPAPVPLGPRRRRCLVWLAGLGAAVPLGMAATAATADAGPVVAAASDLKFVLDDIAQQFTHQTGHPLRISYGSSGNFFRQIVQGAPFELFLSADEDLVHQLHGQGLTEDTGALYGVGRLVLFATKGSPLKVDAALADLRAALADGRVRKLAIANPEHAPYGRAAQQVLERVGLWPAVQGKLVLGENVSQAAQFATSGSAQGGIFALSLALAPALQQVGSQVLLPEHLHSPLRQRMVLTRRAGPVAQQFYRHLQRDDARALLQRYGFALPGSPQGKRLGGG